MELPFAGLHQLCAPMLAQLDAMPEPAAGRARASPSASRRAAPPTGSSSALAALSLLAEVAAERPLLCLVDDAQWLDGASAQVLGFVARRVLAESLAIVFAVREPTDERVLDGLPELALGGLPEDDARALLVAVIPGRLDEHVRDRIVAETRGNPLALLELSRAMTAAELAGGFALPAARGPSRSDRGALRAAPPRLAGGDATAGAAGCGRPRRGRDAALARRGIAGDRPARRRARRRTSSCSRSARRCASGIHWCGRRPIGRARWPSAVRCTWRWPPPRIRRSIPTGGRGIWP